MGGVYRSDEVEREGVRGRGGADPLGGASPSIIGQVRSASVRVPTDYPLQPETFMSIDRYREQLKPAGILYVDVYPYHLSDTGEPRFLLLRRVETGEMPGSWQPVSGKLQEGETIHAGFLRQVRVKTGHRPIELHKLDFVNTFYDAFYDTVMFVPSAACRLAGLDVTIAAKHHQDFRWVSASEAERLLDWPAQGQCIRDVNRRLSVGGGFWRYSSLPIDT
jgi:dATP pyrophosphohydrolase